jgi:hypothetical protein
VPAHHTFRHLGLITVKVLDHLVELTAIEPRATHRAMANVAEIGRRIPALGLTLVRLVDHPGTLMCSFFSSIGFGRAVDEVSHSAGVRRSQLVRIVTAMRIVTAVARFSESASMPLQHAHKRLKSIWFHQIAKI